MECPFCGSLNSKVLNTRLTPNRKSNRRRRECRRCGRRFSTLEGVIPPPLKVIKRSGHRREPFDRDKIVAAVKGAGKKRLTEDKIEEIVNAVCADIMGKGRKEIQTIEIGAALLKRLSQEDEVTYLRLASFFDEFEDRYDFESYVKELEKEVP